MKVKLLKRYREAANRRYTITINENNISHPIEIWDDCWDGEVLIDRFRDIESAGKALIGIKRAYVKRLCIVRRNKQGKSEIAKINKKYSI